MDPKAEHLKMVTTGSQSRLVCAYCDEEIRSGERAENKGSDFHSECLFRAVAGSIAHLRRRCSCYVKDSQEEDPLGLSKREAAKLALAFHRYQVLIMYSIHDHPHDEPEFFVVVHWAIPGSWSKAVPGKPVRLGMDRALSLAQARRLIPEGLHLFPAGAGDDPKIVETWV